MLASLLESLHEPTAVPVLATLGPGDMRAGGARIPGTSYELTPERATEAMVAAAGISRRLSARACLRRWPRRTWMARYAALTGADPPRVSSLYVHCTAEADAGESLPQVLLRPAGCGRGDIHAAAGATPGSPPACLGTGAGGPRPDAGAAVRRPVRTQRSAVTGSASRPVDNTATLVSGSALINGAGRLGLTLSHEQVEQLQRLTAELLRWNKAYNLTAISDPALILTHHLLDSLSAQPELAGTTIADVGTGAGFPGLPLAIVNPAAQLHAHRCGGQEAALHRSRRAGTGAGQCDHPACPGGAAAAARTFDTVIDARLRAAAATGCLDRAAVRPGHTGCCDEGTLAAAGRFR